MGDDTFPDGHKISQISQESRFDLEFVQKLIIGKSLKLVLHSLFIGHHDSRRNRYLLMLNISLN
jgi:hypothetical protein